MASTTEVDSQRSEEISDNRLPKFDKLVSGGDYYNWINAIELHFSALGLWSLASVGRPTYQEEESRKLARCKRDIMFVLSDELQNIVRHKEFAHEMLTTLRKFFVGGKTAELSVLVQRINRIRFDGDFFKLLSEHQAAVTQLYRTDETNQSGFKLLAMQFLNKLPKNMGALTHPLKKKIEASTIDTIQIWNTVYDEVQDYLLDCGLLSQQRREKYKNYKAMNAQKNKRKIKCWNCNAVGHVKSECPKMKKNSQEKPKNVTKEKEDMHSWMALKYTTENKFYLDSGASTHICGEKVLYQRLWEIEPSEMLTANGVVRFKQMGNVLLRLDNGENVLLKDVAYWKEAPNLLSVVKLTEKGFSIQFDNEKALITTETRKTPIYVAHKEDSAYVINFQERKEQPLQTAFLSVAVWHQRLAHVGKQKLSLTLKNKITKKDLEDFSGRICPGCTLGKKHRSPVKKKKPTERAPLEMLVADCMGPFPMPIDKKKGVLVVSNVKLQFT